MRCSNVLPSEVAETRYIEEAGAIAIKTHRRPLKVLLILSKKKPQVRIFPKGHIEPGESAEETARRELLEEAGVSGEPVGRAGRITYAFNGKRYRVVYYVFRYTRKIHNGEKGRDPCWYVPQEAYALLPFDEIRRLLKKTIMKEGPGLNAGGNVLPEG
ncbi:MAG: NUDIX domain-containing protein [Chitinispirillaceae bacterium]|nr:NUDIX domain-containing protein [Chitinispirillaceae bacterium]